jgi:hypothetical protein
MLAHRLPLRCAHLQARLVLRQPLHRALRASELPLASGERGTRLAQLQAQRALLGVLLRIAARQVLCAISNFACRQVCCCTYTVHGRMRERSSSRALAEDWANRAQLSYPLVMRDLLKFFYIVD